MKEYPQRRFCSRTASAILECSGGLVSTRWSVQPIWLTNEDSGGRYVYVYAFSFVLELPSRSTWHCTNEYKTTLKREETLRTIQKGLITQIVQSLWPICRDICRSQFPENTHCCSNHVSWDKERWHMSEVVKTKEEVIKRLFMRGKAWPKDRF